MNRSIEGRNGKYVIKGVNITLDSEDGKKIDCMFIPGISQNPEHEGNEEYSLPTMIYCNPNAMLYEYLQYDDEWVDFYRNLGINLFVWNYRGFGRSTGSPTPAKMYEDAEMIVEYLRNERGINQKIGAHGQSLGGPVAAYLGRNCNIDFLFVDRSFSEIDMVVETSYGKFLKH
mmetsp:Transcript_5508/g.5237  ORF Transcript_5508/g.5237 Transcript_5508/m.5237 type:complete len:173 (-) Transcript_5508:306-824(-)